MRGKKTAREGGVLAVLLTQTYKLTRYKCLLFFTSLSDFVLVPFYFLLLKLQMNEEERFLSGFENLTHSFKWNTILELKYEKCKKNIPRVLAR